MLPNGWSVRIALAIEIILVGLLTIGVTGRIPALGSLFFSDSVQLFVALLTAMSLVDVARKTVGLLRRLWLLFATAIFGLFLAQSLVTYFNNVTHRLATTPWPSDIIFILWVLPALMMLLPQTLEETGAHDWLAILDFAQVGIVALTAYVYFYYIASEWQSQGHLMVLRVMRLQGYRDVVVAVIFFLASRAVAPTALKELYARVSVFFLLNLGPTLLYLLTWQNTQAKANWSGVAWCIPCVTLTAIAGTWKNERPIGLSNLPMPLQNTVASQILPVCIPLLVLYLGRQIAQEQTTIAWIAITVAFCMSATRLVLTNEKQKRIADDLRKTEGALLQSSEIFGAAFHSSPDAISISLLPDGRYLTVNDSFLHLTGYERNEVLGNSAARLRLWVNDEHRTRVLDLLRTASEVKEEEFLIRTKTGEIRSAQLSAARVQLTDGIGVLGMIRDVTDRRQAEEALRASEQRFRSLVQEMHVGIVILGPEAETTYANAAALRIFGLDGDAVRGKSTDHFGMMAINEDGTEMPFADRPGPQAIATKQSIYSELVGWRRKDKDPIWTLVDAVPQLTEQGEIANVVLTISDITELKRAEKALQTSEQLFRTLVESMSICVVLLDAEAKVLFANQATLQLFGRTIEEVTGKTSSELGIVALREDGTAIPFEMRPGPQAIASRTPILNRLIGWRRSESLDTVWTKCDVIPVFNKDGGLEKLVGALSDITKLKEAEEGMHQLSTRLLRLQDEERRRLGRELHDSVAQSVLAASLDLAQIAKAPVSLDKTSRTSLSRARATLREMSREIRTLSYLLHPPVLDELGLVSAIKEYAHGFSERSGIALEMDVQPDFARISQEAEIALFRIVQESLTNIQRHSGSATGMIRLRSETGSIRLEVIDAGYGIAGEVDSKMKATRLGVGILGMRERMAQLGGTLEVISGPSGTTVKATIPLIPWVSNVADSNTRGG